MRKVSIGHVVDPSQVKCQGMENAVLVFFSGLHDARPNLSKVYAHARGGVRSRLVTSKQVSERRGAERAPPLPLGPLLWASRTRRRDRATEPSLQVHGGCKNNIFAANVARKALFYCLEAEHEYVSPTQKDEVLVNSFGVRRPP